MLTVNKDQAITKLNRLIEDGRQNAGQVIEHVMNHQPQDYIVKANALQFSGNGGLRVALNNAEFGVHRFALGQIAEIASVPTKFVDALTGDEWGRALIAHNLNEIFSHRDAKRHLVRTVNGNEVRGFLSDSYGRRRAGKCAGASQFAGRRSRTPCGRLRLHHGGADLVRSIQRNSRRGDGARHLQGARPADREA
jgi:hypothetical protein